MYSDELELEKRIHDKKNKDKSNNELNISMHHVIDTLNSVRKELNRIATAIEDQNKLEKDKLNNNTLINDEQQTILLENK